METGWTLLHTPLTADDITRLLAPAVMVVTGLVLFLLPGRSMNHLKLEGVAEHPEAIGEARSTFAGFPLAIGGLALMMGESVIMFILAASLAVASLGKLAHMLFDGARRKSVLARLVITICLTGLAYGAGEIPVRSVSLPSTPAEILPAISAAITLVFGVVCFLAPITALHLMRLRPRDAFPEARGEVRGLLAGFYIGIGLGVLLIGGFYPALLLGLAWTVTAFGRIISMLSDGTNNTFNWISLLLELVLACLPLGVVLGLFG